MTMTTTTIWQYCEVGIVVGGRLVCFYLVDTLSSCRVGSRKVTVLIVDPAMFCFAFTFPDVPQSTSLVMGYWIFFDSPSIPACQPSQERPVIVLYCTNQDWYLAFDGASDRQDLSSRDRD